MSRGMYPRQKCAINSSMPGSAADAAPRAAPRPCPKRAHRPRQSSRCGPALAGKTHSLSHPLRHLSIEQPSQQNHRKSLAARSTEKPISARTAVARPMSMTRAGAARRHWRITIRHLRRRGQNRAAQPPRRMVPEFTYVSVGRRPRMDNRPLTRATNFVNSRESRTHRHLRGSRPFAPYSWCD